MVPYILAFGFAMLMSYAIQKNKKYKSNAWLLAILIVGMALFIGFRFNVGTDYGSYYRTYEKYSRMSWGELLVVDDPGLRIIAKLSSYLIDSPITMFVIAALIFCSLFITSIYEYTENFLFAMFLFVCSGTFLEAFNGVKQATAMAIIFYGFRFIKQKSFIKYLITILIATIFHSTAIVMVVLYWLFSLKSTKFNLVLVLVVSVALSSSYELLFTLVEAITGKKVNLEYTYYVTQVNVFRVAFAVAPCIVLFLMKEKDRVNNSHFCNMLVFNAALMVITSSSAFLARIGMYSTAFISISLVTLKGKIMTNRNTKSIIDMGIIVLYFVFFIVSVLRTADLYPYQLFF
ncbi:MAG: EpsG family protein [Clostridia bacterium]|nr:EpsG family protein [Clostridia bacterium]